MLIPEKWLPNPPPDPAWRRRIVEPEPLISIIGVVHSEDEIEVTSLMRLNAVRDVVGGTRTALIAELIGGDGRALAGAPAYRLRAHGHGEGGCGCEGEKAEDRYPYAFQAFVSDAAPGAALRIRAGEREVWGIRAPGAEPRVADFRARVKRGDRKGAQIACEWKIKSAGDDPPEVWLQWSKDRGKTWHALASGLRGPGAVFDVSALPSGRVAVRLLASDGFHTAVSKQVQLAVPKRAAAVSILSPRDGQTLVAGGPMRAWAAVSHGDGEVGSAKDARWLVDGKEAGRGLDAFITAPRAGQHRLTLKATADGGKVEQTVRFVTVEVPEEREER